MSVSASANPKSRNGSSAKLLIAFVAIIAAGVGLAWLGAGSLRPEVTPSGLEFRAVAEGTGEPITMNDVALVEYEGRLDDGTVFDSSDAHGGPQPLSPTGMVPGFSEAMQKMREGGEYRIKLPPKLAYGNQPPPGLPPNSALNFEVKVLKIARGAAAMMQNMQPQR
jgi:FKBP-type peptidyl-prolyl cis-trans isomerase FkpA